MVCGIKYILQNMNILWKINKQYFSIVFTLISGQKYLNTNFAKHLSTSAILFL